MNASLHYTVAASWTIRGSREHQKMMKSDKVLLGKLKIVRYSLTVPVRIVSNVMMR